jgi:hypothetical protein
MRSAHATYLARAKSSLSATASDSSAGDPTPREVRQPRRPCYVLAAESEKKDMLMKEDEGWSICYCTDAQDCLVPAQDHAAPA